MNVLVICQGPAYGDERSYNGLRLAGALAKRDGTDVKGFLIGDGVTCAVAGQKVPDGYYHLDRMITAAGHHDIEIGCCATCMDARAITDGQLTAPPSGPPSRILRTGCSGRTRPSRSDEGFDVMPRQPSPAPPPMT